MPLCIALTAGRYDLASCMLSQGAKINACDPPGRSLLQRAVYKDNVPDLQLLISQGASLDTVHEVTKMRTWTKAVQVYKVAVKVVARRRALGLELDVQPSEWHDFWSRRRTDSALAKTWDQYEKKITALVGHQQYGHICARSIEHARRGKRGRVGLSINGILGGGESTVILRSCIPRYSLLL